MNEADKNIAGLADIQQYLQSYADVLFRVMGIDLTIFLLYSCIFINL
jgi:hypothetical protein